ncbi:MAG: histidinol-phosphate transaminase [Bacteroidota bacterium]
MIPFKKYLQEVSTYEGGKSVSEVAPKGIKIHKLSSNENPLGASPKVVAAVQKQLQQLSIYPDGTDTRLRTALANFYQNQLSAEQFLTANSGLACIELIVHAFMEQGTNAIYCNPAFGPYHAFPKKIGATAIDIPLIGDNFSLDIPAILAAVNEQTRLIFVTSPNNPTGTHIPKAQLDELITKLPSHVILVIDEVYYQFTDAPDFVRPLPYVLANKNIIGINSFSKAYGLAGLRIGYAYSTPEIASYLRQLRRPFMINSLSFEAAIAALDDNDFIQKTVELVHQEKQFLYQSLDKLDVKYWKTQANFILIEPEMSPLDFERSMLEKGIMVRPVAGFGAPKGVRVTIGTHQSNVAFLEAYKAIKAAAMVEC